MKKQWKLSEEEALILPNVNTLTSAVSAKLPDYMVSVKLETWGTGPDQVNQSINPTINFYSANYKLSLVTAPTCNGILYSGAHLFVFLIKVSVQQMCIDPVQAADAVLYGQVLLLIIRRRRAEHNMVQTCHHVLLKKVHHLLYSLVWHAWNVQQRTISAVKSRQNKNMYICENRCVTSNPNLYAEMKCRKFLSQLNFSFNFRSFFLKPFVLASHPTVETM